MQFLCIKFHHIHVDLILTLAVLNGYVKSIENVRQAISGKIGRHIYKKN